MLCGGLTALWATVWRFFFSFPFFVFFVRCDELSDFPPSRLKVQHIPGCSGQYDFNLFSQAGRHRQTDTIWFGIPVPVPVPLLQSFNLSLGKYQRGESRVAVNLCPTCAHPQNIWASHRLAYIFTLSYLPGGITPTRGAHSFVTAEKTKRKGWRLRNSQPMAALIQQRHIRAECVCHFTGPSQSAGLSVKDTPKPLWKVWGGDELWHRWGRPLIMTSSEDGITCQEG